MANTFNGPTETTTINGNVLINDDGTGNYGGMTCRVASFNSSVNTGITLLMTPQGAANTAVVIFAQSGQSVALFKVQDSNFNTMMQVDQNGNVDVTKAGSGLMVKEGSNCKQGTATLSSGSVVVANTSVTANSRILLTAQDNNSVGVLRVSARTAGTSFTITSSSGTDSGVVAYQIFEPG